VLGTEGFKSVADRIEGWVADKSRSALNFFEKKGDDVV
jgi:hypothetical protein